MIERAAGITLASRLLGHANEQITRGSYVVTAEQVDPVTAEILDEASKATDPSPSMGALSRNSSSG
jgi:hypothetical protein